MAKLRHTAEQVDDLLDQLEDLLDLLEEDITSMSETEDQED